MTQMNALKGDTCLAFAAQPHLRHLRLSFIHAPYVDPMGRPACLPAGATAAFIRRHLSTPPYTFATMQLQNYIAGQWRTGSAEMKNEECRMINDQRPARIHPHPTWSGRC